MAGESFQGFNVRKVSTVHFKPPKAQLHLYKLSESTLLTSVMLKIDRPWGWKQSLKRWLLGPYRVPNKETTSDGLCWGLNCVSPNPHVEFLTLSVNGALMELIKVT